MNEPLIAIRDLHYRYAGASEDVLRIPTLDVSGSGLIAITGPSGAGKTTLVELLAGTLHEPFEGTVQVLGRDWKDLRRDADRQRQLRRIGLIPQDFGLLPSWTPRRTLEQDLSDAQVPSEQRDIRVQASLAQVGLSDFAERDIGALSGGQRQRVAIARMLARDVELVIADEPTANLDPDLVADVAGLFKELARKVPVIVVTHDPRMAEMCDRTIVLQAAVSTSAESSQTAAGPPASSHRSRLVVGIAVGLLVAGALAVVLFALDSGHGQRRGSVTTRPRVTATPRPRVTVLSSPGADQYGYGMVRFLNQQDSGLSITVEIVAATTLDAKVYPAQSARQWYAGLHLRVSNVGHKPYVGAVAGHFVMFDDHNTPHAETVYADANGDWLPDVLQSISLAPGETTSGWVYFELGRSVTPVSLEFSPAGFVVTGSWGIS